jgi:hypothetical protein
VHDATGAGKLKNKKKYRGTSSLYVHIIYARGGENAATASAAELIKRDDIFALRQWSRKRAALLIK